MYNYFTKIEYGYSCVVYLGGNVSGCFISTWTLLSENSIESGYKI